MGCSQNTQLKNCGLQVIHLEGAEIQTRRPANKAQITVNAAAPRGARLVNLTSDVAVDLYPGSLITIPGTTRRLPIVIKETISLAASTPTDVVVAPLFDAIPASQPAGTFYLGLVPLLGITTFNLQNAEQTVDATSVDSGDGQETDIVRSGRNMSIEGIAKAGDRGYYDVIQPILFQPGFLGCEVYAEFVYPDGELIVGAAKLTNPSQPGNQNEIKRYSFEAQFQGDSYDHFPPYLFA